MRVDSRLRGNDIVGKKLLMVTHTVYGCLLANGTLEFDDTASGCTGATITGCLVESGEHEGKIEITHDYDGCETQYYACLDETTGKFEFEADDGCCEQACDDYSPPATISVTFSVALTNCAAAENCGEGECECEAYLEGTWILPLTDATGPSWAWGDTDDDVCPDYFVPGEGCIGIPLSLAISVSLVCVDDVFTLRVSAGWPEQGADSEECFRSADVVTICPGADPIVNNDNISCPSVLAINAKNGTATISGLC